MSRRATKAILAACPNVVPLPTAAPRRIENSRWKEQRQASGSARAVSPFKDRYIAPQVRAKLPDAAALLLLDRSAELLLAIAIFEALEEPQKKRVRSQCEMLKFTGPSARGAAVVIQLRTIGDSVDLDAAMKVLKDRGDA